MPVRPGAVTAQQPAAGARVEQGDVVKLTVAK
jgi:beta-lactam-binding protein with PASTA domain